MTDTRARPGRCWSIRCLAGRPSGRSRYYCVFDTTTLLVPDPELEYRVEGDQDGLGLPAIVPGAAYLNCQDDLSITPHEFRFTLPEPADFAATRRRARASATITASGPLQPHPALLVHPGLVVASTAMGFDRAMVLDGGYASLGRAPAIPVSTDPSSPCAARHLHGPPRVTGGDLWQGRRPRRARQARGGGRQRPLGRAVHAERGGMAFGRAGAHRQQRERALCRRSATWRPAFSPTRQTLKGHVRERRRDPGPQDRQLLRRRHLRHPGFFRPRRRSATRMWPFTTPPCRNGARMTPCPWKKTDHRSSSTGRTRCFSTPSKSA